MASTETTDQALRKAAMIAGIALLVMAIVAGLTNFGIFEGLIARGDGAKTAADVAASEGLFRLGIVGWVFVAILDVVVAWALLVFFKPVHKGLATLAAWFRLVYAGILMVAASQLLGAVQLLSSADYAKLLGPGQLQAEAMIKLDTFYAIWDVGLIFFGLHLLLLGYLAFKSGYVPKLLGALVVVAGLGYVLDSFGLLLTPDPWVKVTMVTFIGEVILFVWLLIKGRRVTLAK